MPRRYKVCYNGTLTNAGGNTDLLSIQPADDKPVFLVGLILSQTSEVGDAAEENLRITINRLPATFTVGSGGSAVTPVQGTSADSVAAGFTARCNDTTVSTTSGSLVVLEDFGWNERNTPLERWWPDREWQNGVTQTEALVVRCESTAADDLTISLTFFLEEYP